jgi:predicted metal-dependent phosphoesterase TrpH
LIDLHTHTTASDGRCTPVELVARAARAGVHVLSVTDHDTTAGCDEAAAASAREGIEFVPGIEITAVGDGRDVHVLGYFVNGQSASFQAFLADQRRQRSVRARQIIDRLRSHGIVLDADEILAPAADDPGKSVGRPWIARALVAAKHVASVGEAFEQWLGRGRPAFVPRHGASPEDVFGRIHDAGGIASLAHPFLMARDHWLPGYAAAGLDALEAYHSDHGPEATEHYLGLARALGLLVSGGSDYHGDDSHAPAPGSVSLPREAFDALEALRSTRQRRT